MNEKLKLGITAEHIGAYGFMQHAHPINYDGGPNVPFSDETRQFIPQLIQRIDQQLVQKVGTFIQLSASKEQVAGAMKSITSGIIDTLKNNPDSQCVSILMATTPMLATIYQKTIGFEGIRERIHPVRIIRTMGSELGETKQITPIEISTNKESPTIIHDDVVDSGIALLTAIIEIKTARLQENESLNEKYTQLLTTLEEAQKKHQPYEELTTQYDIFAEILAEENIVIAVPYHKNMPLRTAITKKTQKYSGSEWAETQNTFLKDTLAFEQTDWIMGGGTDTGFNINDILESTYLSDKERTTLKENPIIQDLIMHNTIIRIGSTNQVMLALEPGEEAAQAFKKWVVRSFSDPFLETAV